MKKQTRLLALLVCAGLLFVLFASSAYIAHEADHHCAGKHCEICENIARMEALLQSFALLGVVLVFMFALQAFIRVLRAEEGLCAYHAPTLVGWKVRLNN
ncbi:MAG: hypothetical protein IKQ41_02305 [Clostridia bacterium]|nr:hypothetical protein [Clostridia bacterium]